MKNIFGLFLFFALQFSIQGAAQSIKATLLGTGVPQPSIERFGPATLIEAGNEYFLFDCGRGTAQRIWQQKIPLGKVNRLFLTHLHSDHTVGIPDLWLTGWISTAFGQRKTPLQVWGPSGTTEMMQGLKEAYSWDIKIRREENNKSDSGVMVVSRIVNEGIIYDEGGVTITAFFVDHADFIDSAFGFRLDYQGHSVVISGDTRFNNNLIQHAKHADVLIHEVAIIQYEVSQKSALAKQILSYHTSPDQAGKVFSLAQPKLAVFSHIAMPVIDTTIPPPTVADIIAGTRKHYKGPLEVGEDLMTIEIGDSIVVKRPSGKKVTAQQLRR
jgi:ribonuclease Z